MNKPALPVHEDAQRPSYASHPSRNAVERSCRSTDEGMVRRMIAARRTREAMLGRDLFADPAWDLLLELYATSLAQRRLSTLNLCTASAVPPSTSLRWIDKLESAGLVTRADDPLDSRRVWVEISPDGSAKMAGWLDAIRSPVAGT